MIFTFNSKFIGFGSPSSTLEFEADALEDVLVRFEDFLRGSGYHFDGHLDFVNDDWEEIPEMPLAPNYEWESTVDSLMNPPTFRAADLTGKNA